MRAILGLTLIAACASRPARPEPPTEKPLSVADAVALLRHDHVDGAKIPDGVADLDATVRALGDPWTRRMNAAEAADFLADVSEGGTAVGIGLTELLSIDLALDGKTPIVVAPMPGSPAARAGLRPRDRIVAVDGVATDGLAWSDLMRRLRGTAGTRVRLTVEHDGRRDVELTREPRPAGNATVISKVEGSALRLAIGRFVPGTSDEVRAALAANPTLPVIVDLRGNPGGDLTASLAVMGLLAGPADVVHLHTARAVETLRSTGEGPARPVVEVDVDEGTASAAEILALGLRSAVHARIVGPTTAGKCLVHGTSPLEGGGLLLYTVGRITPLDDSPLCGVGVGAT